MGKMLKSDDEWRAQLSEEEYAVTREAATERPFTGRYWNTDAEGVYTCVCCGHPLFESESKFDAGCGWPSFSAPREDAELTTRDDYSRGMHRVEVICSHCDAHLGHVFEDGPEPTGLRFCMNSAALNLDQGQDE